MDDLSTTPLSERTHRSHLDSAVRLSADAEPTIVLARIARRLIDVAARWDCTITVNIEPDGDACDTGHFINIETEHGAIWADMTPWPQRFDGAIPRALDAELDAAGWILKRDGADPDPMNSVRDLPEFMTDDDLETAELPARRLVAFPDTDDLLAWADKVVHAVNRVLAPRSHRWYLMSNASAMSGGALINHPGNRPGEFYGLWTVDLGQLMVDSEWDRAVWPAMSEAAYLACKAGLHQYHEPPCIVSDGVTEDWDTTTPPRDDT